MSKRIGPFCLLMAAMGGCAMPPSASVPVDAAAGAPVMAATMSEAGAPAASAAAATTKPGALPGPESIYGSNGTIAVVTIGEGANAVTRKISVDQFLKPLIESHGLNTLLLVVQLELAKQAAASIGMLVSPADIAAERDATLGKLFQQADDDNEEKVSDAKKTKNADLIKRAEKKKQDDHDLLLKNFLEQQRISPAELDLILETNAYLRKVAEPNVRKAITEDMLRERFSVKYNEQVKVRHIQLNSADAIRQAGEIKRKLAAGETFAKLAREYSQNPTTSALEGELPAFTREDTRLPQNFRDAAFALKQKDEVSDIINAGGVYQLIQLVERIAPKTLKFEDVRDSLARDLAEEATSSVMGKIRQNIGVAARRTLKISDPVLAEQFQRKIAVFDKKPEASTDRVVGDLEANRHPGGANPGNGGKSPAGPSATDPTTGAPAMPKNGGPVTTDAPPQFGPAPATLPARAKPVAPTPGAPTPVAPATQPAGAASRPAGVPK